MYYYALTLTRLVKPALPHHYETFLHQFMKEYPKASIEYHYEESQKNQWLHIHAMVKTPHKIYVNKLKRFAPSDEFRLQFVFVKNKVAWKAYITKDTKIEPELLSKWKQEEYDFYHPDLTESEELIEEYIENPKITKRIV